MVTLGAEAAQPRMVQLMFCSLEERGPQGKLGPQVYLRWGPWWQWYCVS